MKLCAISAIKVHHVSVERNVDVHLLLGLLVCLFLPAFCVVFLAVLISVGIMSWFVLIVKQSDLIFLPGMASDLIENIRNISIFFIFTLLYILLFVIKHEEILLISINWLI